MQREHATEEQAWHAERQELQSQSHAALLDASRTTSDPRIERESERDSSGRLAAFRDENSRLRHVRHSPSHSPAGRAAAAAARIGLPLSPESFAQIATAHHTVTWIKQQKACTC